MPIWSIIVLILVGILLITFGIFLFRKLFSICSLNIKETIKRAQKIDPSVKTLNDANYVLSNELVKNIGNNKKITHCKHCGKEIDIDSQFCKHCGKNQ